MLTLESARLWLREIDHDSLSALLPVYESNTEMLLHFEGSEGEPGRYDLARWQRDWHIAQLMGRETLGCYLKEDETPVGYIDFLEENEDGAPWIGLLLIHRDYQRRGLGTEAFRRLEEHFRRDRGWTLVRTSVSEANAPALAFAYHLGFQPYKQVNKKLASGTQLINWLELDLSGSLSK